MNNVLRLGVALAAMVILPVYAQLHLNTNTNDPVTGLDPADWEGMIGAELNANALVGVPGVLIVSSVPVPLTITCDKWDLVGPNVYSSVKGNPTEIKPFSVTFIHTTDFDGYCKGGVIGHSGMGQTIVGCLDAADGTFKNSRVILFSGRRR